MARPSACEQNGKVLLLEGIHSSAREAFRAEGFEVEEVVRSLKEEELVERVASGVCLLGIRSKTKVTRRVLDAGRELVAVGAFCIGTNQIDLRAANLCGVPVFNAPFSNTRSVAELVIAEVVMLARRVGDLSRELHAGRWRKPSGGSFEVRGKTLGIVGYGHIGSQVGVLAEAMGMGVVYYDIRATLPMGNNRPVDSLPELLRAADFVTLHVPETPQTRGMMGEEALGFMREGAYLLNLSRGSVVDLLAVASALKAKRLAGVALDVYPEEPESASEDFRSELVGLPNVVLTPHVGGSTAEAQEAIGREVSGTLARFARRGATTGAVNFPAVELPPVPGAHRVVNVHQNVPGVLRDIHRVVSERNGNVLAQVLATDAEIGYLIMDLDREVAADVEHDVAALPTSIRTRILY